MDGATTLSLVLPSRSGVSAPREELLARLEALQHPAIVAISGHSGYGKSTLARQWCGSILESGRATPVWVGLSGTDNDVPRLYQRISQSVREAVPSITSLGSAPTRDANGDYRFGGAFANLISLDPPLLVVLDDLHFLFDTQCKSLIDALLSQGRPTTSFVVVSRSDPAATFPSLADAPHVAHIDSGDLRLRFSDMRDAAAQAGFDINTEAGLREIYEMTQGWPIAVDLWSHSSVSGGPPPRLSPGEPLVAASRWSAPLSPTRPVSSGVLEDLLDRLLDSLPALERDFLRDTCILEELTVLACNQVRDSTDSEQIIRSLEGMLLTRTGARPRMWQAHALLRDILRERLESTDQGRWRELHGRAASLYASRQPMTAVSHHILAGNFDEAAAILDTRLADISTADYIDGPALVRFVESMPAAAVAKRPSLLVRSLVSARFARRHEVYEGLLTVYGGIDRASLEGLLAECEAADAAGDATMMKVAAEAGLKVALPGSRWELDFHSALAHAEELLGNWGAAIASLRRLRRPASKMPPTGRPAQETIHAAIAVNLAKAGHLDGARGAIGELQEWIADARDLGYESEGLLGWATAMLHYYSGQFEAAYRTWSSRPPITWSYGQPLIEVIYLLDLARVFARTGHVVDAAVLLDELDQILSRFANPGRFPQWTAALRAELAARRPIETGLGAAGPVKPPSGAGPDRREHAIEAITGRELDVLRMLCSEFSGPEIAQLLCISYNTVKSHVKSVYRKLDAESRSQAVAHARERGYFT